MQNNLINEVNDCVTKFHPDMYFSALYHFIAKNEYNLEDSVRQADKNEVFAKWKKLSSLSFQIACKIEDKYFQNISSKEEKQMLDTYYKVLEFGGDFDMAISMYFCYRDDAEKLIQEEFGKADFEKSQTRFYEICMENGKRIAENRLEKQLNSTEYFGLEFIETPDQKVYKLFLTPKGYLHKEKLIDFVELNTIDSYIEDFMTKNGLKKIKNSTLQKDLETKMIFEDEQSRVFYYKRRVIGDDGQSFNQQSVKDPLMALIGQGQCNLTLRE